MKKAVLILALMLSAPTFAASLEPLSKNEVMKSFEDKTITTVPVVTLHGNLVMNNSASVFFAKSGDLSGHFASKPDSDPQTDQGTWKVEADGKLCVTWKTWTEGKPVCLYSYKLANAIVFVTAEKKFESMVPIDNIESGNQVH